MLFDRITHSYEVFRHFVDMILSHQGLRMLYSMSRLEHVFLLLKDTEPRCIELTPEPYPITVQGNFVYSKSLSETISAQDQTEEMKTYPDHLHGPEAIPTPQEVIDLLQQDVH